MNLRQRILKIFYPVIIKFGGRKLHKANRAGTAPPISFYSLQAKLLNGEIISMEKFKGKKIIVVNTASNCGYTNQYESLQQLYSQEKNRLVIIAFPSDDFNEQETGTNEEIQQFCTTVYQLNFPVVQKTIVKKMAEQHPIYKWLTHKPMNGWNDKDPSWNFSKYIINEEGILTDYFDPGFDPLDKEVLNALGAVKK